MSADAGADVLRPLSVGDAGELLTVQRAAFVSEAWATGLAEMAVAQNAGSYDSEVDPARGVAPTTLAEWSAEVLRPALAD